MIEAMLIKPIEPQRIAEAVALWHEVGLGESRRPR